MGPIRKRLWAGSRLAPALLALALTGCGVLGGGRPAYPNRYTLSTPTPAAPTQTKPAAYSITLELAPVDAPDWLDSRRMLYRLAYTNDNRLAAYTRSAWADTPAQLVGDHLDTALSARHLFSAVLSEGAGQADFTLQLSLDDFSQHFTDEHDSRGRITAQATLISSATGKVVGQKRFDASAPAPSADAAGGVKALARANAQLDDAIAAWLVDRLAECGQACRGQS